MSGIDPIFTLAMATLGSGIVLAVHQLVSVSWAQQERTVSALARRGGREHGRR